MMISVVLRLNNLITGLLLALAKMGQNVLVNTTYLIPPPCNLWSSHPSSEARMFVQMSVIWVWLFIKRTVFILPHRPHQRRVCLCKCHTVTTTSDYHPYQLLIRNRLWCFLLFNHNSKCEDLNHLPRFYSWSFLLFIYNSKCEYLNHLPRFLPCKIILFFETPKNSTLDWTMDYIIIHTLKLGDISKKLRFLSLILKNYTIRQVMKTNYTFCH